MAARLVVAGGHLGLGKTRMGGSKLEHQETSASAEGRGDPAPEAALHDGSGAGQELPHVGSPEPDLFAGPPPGTAAPVREEPFELSFPPPRRGELSPDAIQTARPSAPDDPDAAAASTDRIAPPPASLPTIDVPSAGEMEETTIVAELPDELRAQQKGYRKTSPREALRQQLGRYDDSAEIEVHGEDWLDGLLVEELLADVPPGAEARIGVGACGRSDQGRRRRRNEDALLVMPEHHVYLVADGMGGHAAGEVASQTAVDITRQAFAAGRFAGEPNVLWPLAGDELARTVEMANAEIFRMASADEGRTGMGTTVTAMRISPHRQRVYIAHVGDSRAYRLRRGELTRLTTDHTVGQLYGVQGPMAGHLCRAVGIEPTVEVDLLVDLPELGDLYLLCSDGLTKMVEDADLSRHLGPGGDLTGLVEALVGAANGSGGVDNITVVLVRIEAP